MRTPDRTQVPGSARAVPSATPPRHVPGAARRPLPDAVRSRMEASFGADFSGVTVSENDQPARLAAVAFTGDEGISFGRGEYDPHSREGLAVIGHELAHVLQQRAGRVRGSGVADDPVLEAEADEAGVRAARGEVVSSEVPGVDAAPDVASVPTTGVVQRKDGDKIRALQQKLMGQANAPAPANRPPPVNLPAPPPQRPGPAPAPGPAPVPGPPPNDIYANADPGQAAAPAAPQPVPVPVRAAPQAVPQQAPRPAQPPVVPVADYRESFLSMFDPELKGELGWAIDRLEGIVTRQVSSGAWSPEGAEMVRKRFQGRLAGIAKGAQDRLVAGRRQTGRELAELLKSFTPGKPS